MCGGVRVSQSGRGWCSDDKLNLCIARVSVSVRVSVRVRANGVECALAVGLSVVAGGVVVAWVMFMAALKVRVWFQE